MRLVEGSKPLVQKWGVRNIFPAEAHFLVFTSARMCLEPTVELRCREIWAPYITLWPGPRVKTVSGSLEEAAPHSDRDTEGYNNSLASKTDLFWLYINREISDGSSFDDLSTLVRKQITVRPGKLWLAGKMENLHRPVVATTCRPQQRRKIRSLKQPDQTRRLFILHRFHCT